MTARIHRLPATAGIALALALAAPATRAQDPDVTGLDRSGLVIPSSFGPGVRFENEMSALSWNLQTVLILWSGELDPDDPYAAYDPSDPATAPSRGKCSFSQPWYCSSVRSFFGIVRPESAARFVRLPTSESLRGGVSHGVAAESAVGSRGRPAPPEPEPPVAKPAPPRRVDPQSGRPLPPPTRGPVLPDGTLPEELPSRPDGIRDGGNTSFGRRDFVWHEAPPPGCLPPRSGLSGLSAPRAGSGWRILGRQQRPGRCPPR